MLQQLGGADVPHLHGAVRAGSRDAGAAGVEIGMRHAPARRKRMWRKYPLGRGSLLTNSSMRKPFSQHEDRPQTA